MGRLLEIYKKHRNAFKAGIAVLAGVGYLTVSEVTIPGYQWIEAVLAAVFGVTMVSIRKE